MALVKPDFSEVAEEVGPGTYRGVIKSAEMGKWEKSGTEYVNWTIETVGSQDPKNNGRKIFHKTPVSGKGAFRLQDFYKAAMGQSLTAAGFDTQMLLGRQIELTLVEGVNRATGEKTGYIEVDKVRTAAQ